jgi:site-specific DNA-methyltransferase (adenine-specific)/modification methylase
MDNEPTVKGSWPLVQLVDGVPHWYIAGTNPPQYAPDEVLARVWRERNGMQPYYQHAGITIYHGDAREIAPQLPPVDCTITDPVWPNVPAGLYAGSDDPHGLFAATLPLIDMQRLVVVLGCNSDPRFLSAVPVALPFLRVCWLEYAMPSYQGRLLYSGDVAYVYGTWPAARPGNQVFPGRSPKAQPHKHYRDGHPTPRAYEHMRWLVGQYARGPVLDPFCGGGTTLHACKDLGIPAIGIEIDERYCEAAARSLSQEVMTFESETA